MEAPLPTGKPGSEMPSLRFVNQNALTVSDVGILLKLVRPWTWTVLLCALFAAAPAAANTCSTATSQGTAPADWQTYCWLDFAGYNDATAKSAAGQNFSFTLSDGSTLTLTVKASSANPTAFVATTAPSWTGAAVGNSAFIGIPGSPIIYTSAAGTSTVTLSNITITPAPGAGAATAYMFIAADAESTDGAESLAFTTNGGNWQVVNQVPPITGAQYPATTNAGSTFTMSGNNQSGNVGGWIIGSTTPTQVSGAMSAGGLQGAMFAVRFASLRLTKTIVGTRLNAADQFTYTVKATGTGTTLTSGTTSGSGNGPFASASVSLASGLPLTIGEAMATGSVSALSSYSSRLTCTNSNTGSSTTLPVNLATTSYNFGTLQYGDAVQCSFTNTPFPVVKLTKALGGTRVFTADQFTMNIAAGATVVATTTTTGTGATVATASTPVTLVTPGTAYSFGEVASGSTNLSYYTAGMVCTNSYAGSTTVLPTAPGGTVTPALADNISCTITNTPKPAKAELSMTKVAVVLSDPVNGTTNPKMIPGATIIYAMTVTNIGRGPVDAGTVVITDALPGNVYPSVLGISFTDGTTSSGLTFSNAVGAGNLSWSKAPGGGAPYTTSVTPDADGYDVNVTGVRIAPSGTMAAATASGQPSFTVALFARIK
jgi:uncharacterized repeat protein (TIGR01451 family)